MMITIVLYLFLKTIFVSLQSYSFLSAYKKSVLIGYDLVFLCKRILASDNTVITYITIPAGSTTYQCISAIFSAATKVMDIPIYHLYSPADLPDYFKYKPEECPMCKAGQPVDALCNGFGYSIV